MIVDDVRVRYQVAGRGDPVVLLHGWPTSSALWSRQIRDLAEHMRVYAIDFPGFGESEKPEPGLGLDDLADVLVGFLDEMQLPRVALVAHDLGGPAALIATARRPERISRVVVLNTTPYPQLPWLVRLLVAVIDKPVVGRLAASRIGFRIVFRIGTANPHTDRRALADEHWENVRGRWGRRSLRATLAAADADSLARLENRLGAISCPVLVLWGERDRTAPLSIARRLARDLPSATLEIVPHAGHFLPQDAPEAVSDRVIDFLVHRAQIRPDAPQAVT